MRKAQLLISALLLVLLLMACAPKAAPAPALQPPAARAAPVPVAAIASAPARPAWQEELERTAALAQREGRLVLYTSLAGERREGLIRAFRAKYGIPVESMTGTASSLAPRITAERRAGIYSGDVGIQAQTFYSYFAAGILDSLESVFVLPELTQPELIKKTWFFGELSWANKARTVAIALMRMANPIAINTDLMKPGEITTYRDLLDPKWKGKMSLNDPQIGGMGATWFTGVLEPGDVDINYMRELVSKQELFITRDWRIQATWLAQGKRPIAIGLETATEVEFIKAGAALSRLKGLGTPTVSGGSASSVVLFNGAPHPNAAKLFINWILSQEGQIVHSQLQGSQSRRLDVPTTHMEPSDVLKAGFKAFTGPDSEEFIAKRATFYTPLAKEIFGPYTK